MRPIDPPVGGGRLRLLGLYHGLGAEYAADLCRQLRLAGILFHDQMLSPTLREIDGAAERYPPFRRGRSERAAGERPSSIPARSAPQPISRQTYVAAARRAASWRATPSCSRTHGSTRSCATSSILAPTDRLRCSQRRRPAANGTALMTRAPVRRSPEAWWMSRSGCVTRQT